MIIQRSPVELMDLFRDQLNKQEGKEKKKVFVLVADSVSNITMEDRAVMPEIEFTLTSIDVDWSILEDFARRHIYLQTFETIPRFAKKSLNLTDEELICM